MSTSQAVEIVRYARKQAKAFHSGLPGSKPVCQGCELGYRDYPTACQHACLVITRTAARWQRRRAAARKQEAMI
jgi:hypothetical protein